MPTMPTMPHYAYYAYYAYLEEPHSTCTQGFYNENSLRLSPL